jgi:predicted XRE-type DNA-binding protein
MRMKTGTRNLPDHAFRNIGLPDAEILLVKSELNAAIKAGIAKAGWTQKQAGEALGWSQPDISKIMNDRFVQHSIDRLLKAALDLGLTVSFGIDLPAKKTEAGRVALIEAPAAPRASSARPAAKPAAKRRKGGPAARIASSLAAAE